MTPKVEILISIPDEKHFYSCTLVLRSLRIGFPTSPVTITLNQCGHSEFTRMRVYNEIINLNKDVSEELWVEIIELKEKIHHADWIRERVWAAQGNRPLVIVDGDVIFWESVEEWVFPENVLLAGYYVPRIWNDFAKCVSLPRIHTSFMWFPNPHALRMAAMDAYPPCLLEAGEYCPCDPFMPATRFIEGAPFFWDTCSNLYQMLGPAQTYSFSEAHKKAFDHLNSASFYHVMSERLADPRAFKFVHDVAIKTPQDLRNLWPSVDAYYKQKEVEAQVWCSRN